MNNTMIRKRHGRQGGGDGYTCILRFAHILVYSNCTPPPPSPLLPWPAFSSLLGMPLNVLGIG